MNADDARGIVEALTAGTAPPPPAAPTTEDLQRRFPRLDGVTVEAIDVPGPVGIVDARRYRPRGAPSARLVWVHGGAFIAGDLDMPESHWVALELAAEGIEVLSVDYRKALADVVYPVPSDDVLAAWRWAVREWGETPHLAGASAGANLTAGVTARLRDGGEAVPRSLVQVYPLVHQVLPPLSTELREAIADLPPMFVFESDAVAVLNDNYCVDPEHAAYAFPGDGPLGGFPPVLVVNAERDSLRASGERFVRQLRDVGVEVEDLTEPAAMHGYLNEPGDPNAEHTLAVVADWVARH